MKTPERADKRALLKKAMETLKDRRSTTRPDDFWVNGKLWSKMSGEERSQAAEYLPDSEINDEDLYMYRSRMLS